MSEEVTTPAEGNAAADVVKERHTEAEKEKEKEKAVIHTAFSAQANDFQAPSDLGCTPFSRISATVFQSSSTSDSISEPACTVGNPISASMISQQNGRLEKENNVPSKRRILDDPHVNVEDINYMRQWLLTHQQEFDDDIKDILQMAPARIAVFGLSANPPHCGHEEIIKTMSSSGQFDAIVVLPVYLHMFVSKEESLGRVSYEHRVEMCKRAFCSSSSSSYSSSSDATGPSNQQVCRVFVLTLEKLANMCNASRITTSTSSTGTGTDKGTVAVSTPTPSRVGTFYVLQFLSVLMPFIEKISLILGEDAAVDLLNGKWENSESILTCVQLHIITRVDSDSESDVANVGKAIVRSTSNNGSDSGKGAFWYGAGKLNDDIQLSISSISSPRPRPMDTIGTTGVRYDAAGYDAAGYDAKGEDGRRLQEKGLIGSASEIYYLADERKGEGEGKKQQSFSPKRSTMGEGIVPAAAAPAPAPAEQSVLVPLRNILPVRDPVAFIKKNCTVLGNADKQYLLKHLLPIMNSSKSIVIRNISSTKIRDFIHKSNFQRDEEKERERKMEMLTQVQVPSSCSSAPVSASGSGAKPSAMAAPDTASTTTVNTTANANANTAQSTMTTSGDGVGMDAEVRLPLRRAMSVTHTELILSPAVLEYIHLHHLY